MSNVHVKLFATLRRYRPGAKLGEASPVAFPAGGTVDQLICHMGLPPDEIKLVFVNGIIRGGDHVLSDGDHVSLFPPVGGG